jgi:multidrug efflux pump subunit AcrB
LQRILFGKLAAVQDALVFVVAPPPVQGIGNAGGFRMMVEDRAGQGPPALQEAVNALLARARETPGLVQVFSLFESATPQLYLDIDRTKAQMLGVAAPEIFAALQIYIGSVYVNDFNLFGRTFRVMAQAAGPNRREPRDVLDIRVRNASGGTVPLASFTTVRDIAGPYRVPRYNLYPAAEVDGVAARGYSPSRSWRSWRSKPCPRVSATNGRHSPFRNCAPATPRCLRSCWRWFSCSWCWPRSSKASRCRLP